MVPVNKVMINCPNRRDSLTKTWLFSLKAQIALEYFMICHWLKNCFWTFVCPFRKCESCVIFSNQQITPIEWRFEEMGKEKGLEMFLWQKLCCVMYFEKGKHFTWHFLYLYLFSKVDLKFSSKSKNNTNLFLVLSRC